jgi:hypothetical protein
VDAVLLRLRRTQRSQERARLLRPAGEFVRHNIQFDEHGSDCNVCVDIALRAREMTVAGQPLSEIRAAVDEEFSDIGPGTDTPLPPE